MNNTDNKETKEAKNDNSSTVLILICIVFGIIWIIIDYNFISGPEDFADTIKGGFVAIIGLAALAFFAIGGKK